MKSKSMLFAVTAVLLLTNLSTAQAQERRRLPRPDGVEVRTLLVRIEDRADRFKDTLDRALDESRLNGSRREDEINRFVKDFEKATDRLRSRTEDSGAVQEVLRRGRAIDNFMRRNRLDGRAERDWAVIREDLDVLANRYGIVNRWERNDDDRRPRGRRRDNDRRN